MARKKICRECEKEVSFLYEAAGDISGVCEGCYNATYGIRQPDFQHGQCEACWDYADIVAEYQGQLLCEQCIITASKTEGIEVCQKCYETSDRLFKIIETGMEICQVCYHELAEKDMIGEKWNEEDMPENYPENYCEICGEESTILHRKAELLYCDTCLNRHNDRKKVCDSCGKDANGYHLAPKGAGEYELHCWACHDIWTSLKEIGKDPDIYKENPDLGLLKLTMLESLTGALYEKETKQIRNVTSIEALQNAGWFLRKKTEFLSGSKIRASEDWKTEYILEYEL